MKHNLDDTVAAIATPLGVGGVGVIRISGGKAKQVLSQVFISSVMQKRFESHKLYFGKIVNTDQHKIVDRVLAVYMAAPKTFTGEDVVEISCHSGYLVMQEILNQIIGCGCRLAERGEFSKRAFLNGKIDIIQAEAVIDLITAKTNRAMDVAIAQVEGWLSKQIREIRNSLMGLLSLYEGAIDFPDDIEKPKSNHSLLVISGCLGKVKGLIEKGGAGKIIKEGFRAAIIGRTNVGKSSLLNALLGEGRALVTNVHGTTRDTIEEAVDISGIPFVLIDTAGIRRAKSLPESLGIEKTRLEINRADLLIFVIDGSQALHQGELSLIKKFDSKKTIVVINKCDLKQAKKVRLQENKFTIIRTSAINSDGIEALKGEMKNRLVAEKCFENQEGYFINNRQMVCLRRAAENLSNAIKSIKQDCEEEIVVIDIKGAVVSLGEVSGENVTEEAIETIFSRFCVGK